jgi:nitrate/nitrite-specific signal transduction histidine kinase
VALTALACALLAAARHEALQVPAERVRSAQALEALLTVSTQGSAYLARAGEALVSDVPDLEAVREARAAVAAGLSQLMHTAAPADAASYAALQGAFAALDGRVRGALVPGQMRHRAALDAELQLVEATYDQEWAPALEQAVASAQADAAHVAAQTRRLQGHQGLALVLLPGALLLALLALALVVLRPLLAELGTLQLALQRLSAGERGVRVPVRGSDELARLGSAFNRMAWEVERREQGEEPTALTPSPSQKER